MEIRRARRSAVRRNRFAEVIVDTSVLIAILKEEPDSAEFLTAMNSAETLEMSAASYLETGIVTDRNMDPLLTARVDDIISALGIIIAPVTEGQARLAREAYRRFGKGTGHPAGLNFGDCFSYALSKERQEPLLFKGDDFAQCDVQPALAD
jgi:ribonuclease VapC